MPILPILIVLITRAGIVLLGDKIENALSLVGVTKARVARWLGRDCHCRERQDKLNQLGLWAAGFFRRTRLTQRSVSDTIGAVDQHGVNEMATDLASNVPACETESTVEYRQTTSSFVNEEGNDVAVGRKALIALLESEND